MKTVTTLGLFLFVFVLFSCSAKTPTGNVVMIPPTCDDSDGTNFYTQGVVSGTFNGNAFTSSDECATGHVGAGQLNEKICKDQSLESVLYDCKADGANNYCYHGACIRG